MPTAARLVREYKVRFHLNAFTFDILIGNRSGVLKPPERGRDVKLPAIGELNIRPAISQANPTRVSAWDHDESVLQPLNRTGINEVDSRPQIEIDKLREGREVGNLLLRWSFEVADYPGVRCCPVG